MTGGEALACSLSGPEFVERISEWSEVASHAIQRTVEKGRIVSRYPQDQHLLQRLRNLIAAEAECCPFMDFTIQEHAEDFEVELRVPDDMSEALSVMLGLVTKKPSHTASA